MSESSDASPLEEQPTPPGPTTPTTPTPPKASDGARIRRNIAALRAQGAGDDVIAAYLTQREGLSAEGGTPHAPPENHGASGTWGDEPKDLTQLADRSTLGNVSRSVIQGATLGAGLKGMAAANAALDRLHGTPFSEAYQDRLAAERSAAKDFNTAHPVGNLATEVSGGAGAMIASGGASAPEEAANAGRLVRLGARALRAGGAGADIGAVSGAVNADGDLADRARNAVRTAVTGGLGAAVLTPLGEGIGYLARKARVPDALSAGASNLAEKLPSGNRWDALRSTLEDAASALGPRGEAASEVAKRLEMDKGTTKPTNPDIPSLALDEGGVNLEGLAKGIARVPGKANAQIRSALDGRETEAPQRIAAKFDAMAGAQPGAAPSSVGVSKLNQLKLEQKAEASVNYGAARDATAGDPVQSPALDEVMKTPIGKLAFSWARGQMANRNKSLPSVAGAEQPPFGLSPDVWAALKARAGNRPDIMPIEQQVGKLARAPDTEVPDPETLHYMKQYLAKVSRLGVNDGAQGTIATQANGALGNWEKIRAELPDEWRAADAAFADKARQQEMLNTGRGIMTTRLNPPGQRATTTSLDAVDRRVAQASPDEQQAFRTGALSGHADYFKEGGSLPRIVKQIDDPNSAAARRLSLATGGNPDATRAYLSDWNDMIARKKRILLGSDTQGNIAEQQSRAPSTGAMSQLLHGHPVGAVRALIGGAGAEATSAQRQRVDQSIADILTSIDPRTLNSAQGTAQLRARLDALRTSAYGLAGAERANNP